MFSTNTLRRIVALVLLTFTSLTLQPLQAAVQSHPAQSRAQTAPPSRAENASRLLDAIKETAKRAKDKADKRLSTRETVKELRRQKTQFEALEQEVLDDFSATETHLKAKNLPPEIIANFAGARLLTAVATITLLVVFEGYVLLPLAAIIGVAIAMAAFAASLISLFLRIAIIQNGIEFPTNRRQTCFA